MTKDDTPTIFSKTTLFSWGVVATLILAVFWATTVYSDGQYTRERVVTLEIKLESLNNKIIELENELIKLQTEQKYK